MDIVTLRQSARRGAQRRNLPIQAFAQSNECNNQFRARLKREVNRIENRPAYVGSDLNGVARRRCIRLGAVPERPKRAMALGRSHRHVGPMERVMKNFVKRFLHDESGATAIMYGLNEWSHRRRHLGRDHRSGAGRRRQAGYDLHQRSDRPPVSPSFVATLVCTLVCVQSPVRKRRIPSGDFSPDHALRRLLSRSGAGRELA